MANSSPEYSRLKHDLRCPVCLDIRRGSIYQCESGGHTICRSCYGKLEYGDCPICKGPYSSPPKRNLALERLIDGLGLPDNEASSLHGSNSSHSPSIHDDVHGEETTSDQTFGDQGQDPLDQSSNSEWDQDQTQPALITQDDMQGQGTIYIQAPSAYILDRVDAIDSLNLIGAEANNVGRRSEEAPIALGGGLSQADGGRFGLASSFRNSLEPTAAQNQLIWVHQRKTNPQGPDKHENEATEPVQEQRVTVQQQVHFLLQELRPIPQQPDQLNDVASTQQQTIQTIQQVTHRQQPIEHVSTQRNTIQDLQHWDRQYRQLEQQQLQHWQQQQQRLPQQQLTLNQLQQQQQEDQQLSAESLALSELSRAVLPQEPVPRHELSPWVLQYQQYQQIKQEILVPQQQLPQVMLQTQHDITQHVPPPQQQLPPQQLPRVMQQLPQQLTRHEELEQEMLLQQQLQPYQPP